MKKLERRPADNNGKRLEYGEEYEYIPTIEEAAGYVEMFSWQLYLASRILDLLCQSMENAEDVPRELFDKASVGFDIAIKSIKPLFDKIEQIYDDKRSGINERPLQ